MSEAEKTIELAIPLLLPGVEDNGDGRLRLLERALQVHRGILRAHLELDRSPADLCLHYNPNQLGMAEVKQIAELLPRRSVPKRYHGNVVMRFIAPISVVFETIAALMQDRAC